MSPGDIVAVNWRDALPGTYEPNKFRPAVVVGASRFYGDGLPLRVVVPLTTNPALNILDATLPIYPDGRNGCSQVCFALAWNVQTVPLARLRPTASRITENELQTIRDLIAACVDAGPHS